MRLRTMKVLSDDDKQKIHEASLKLLSETGMKIANERALKLLEDAGCEVLTYRGQELSLKAEGGPTCLTRPILRED